MEEQWNSFLGTLLLSASPFTVLLRPASSRFCRCPIRALHSSRRSESSFLATCLVTAHLFVPRVLNSTRTDGTARGRTSGAVFSRHRGSRDHTGTCSPISSRSPTLQTREKAPFSHERWRPCGTAPESVFTDSFMNRYDPNGPPFAIGTPGPFPSLLSPIRSLRP